MFERIRPDGTSPRDRGPEEKGRVPRDGGAKRARIGLTADALPATSLMGAGPVISSWPVAAHWLFGAAAPRDRLQSRLTSTSLFLDKLKGAILLPVDGTGIDNEPMEAAQPVEERRILNGS